MRFTVSDGTASDTFELVSCMIKESNIRLPLCISKFGAVPPIVSKPSSLALNGGEVSVGGQHNWKSPFWFWFGDTAVNCASSGNGFSIPVSSVIVLPEIPFVGITIPAVPKYEPWSSHPDWTPFILSTLKVLVPIGNGEPETDETKHLISGELLNLSQKSCILLSLRPLDW